MSPSILLQQVATPNQLFCGGPSSIPSSDRRQVPCPLAASPPSTAAPAADADWVAPLQELQQHLDTESAAGQLRGTPEQLQCFAEFVACCLSRAADRLQRCPLFADSLGLDSFLQRALQLAAQPGRASQAARMGVEAIGFARLAAQLKCSASGGVVECSAPSPSGASGGGVAGGAGRGSGTPE